MYIVEETWDENNYTSDSKSYISNEQYNIIDLKTIFIILLSLKLAHTFPNTFYFPSFAFAHPSLSVRLQCAQRLFIVHNSALFAPNPFAVTVRSQCVCMRSEIVQRSLDHHPGKFISIAIRNSEVERLS